MQIMPFSRKSAHFICTYQFFFVPLCPNYIRTRPRQACTHVNKEKNKIKVVMNAAQTLVMERHARSRRSVTLNNSQGYGYTTPLVNQSTLDEDCKPLEVAMDILRQRAQNYFSVAK